MDNEKMQKKAEAILETMKNESLRMIHSTETSSTKHAWYYSHLGSIDFARQMGLISEERRQELYEEFERARESNKISQIKKEIFTSMKIMDTSIKNIKESEEYKIAQAYNQGLRDAMTIFEREMKR